MSKEAMKLALEALKNSVDSVSNEAREAESLYGKYQSRLARVQCFVALEVAHQTAIKALEEALAKQEQGEPVACDNCKKLEDELERLRIKAELWKRDSIVWKSAYDVEVGWREQEQDEPVAWESVLGAVARGWCYEENANKTMDFELAVAIAKEVHALYTTQQQRTWVGLSYEEAEEIYSCIHGYDAPKRISEAIEAKLKEKNT